MSTPRNRRWFPLVVYSVVALLFLAATPLLYVLLGKKVLTSWAASTWIALVSMVWSLCVAVDLGRRLPRRRVFIPCLLVVWWCAAETFATPYLRAPLHLVQIDAVQNTDHRPKDVGRGWNSDHLRGTPEPKEFRPGDFNIVFLGDSFTYGLWVKPEECFPSLVGRKLKEWKPELAVHVANFAWVSSSPLLSWRRLLDVGEHYAPDLVVMCVDMTDFSDDIRYADMLERRGIYRWYDRFPMSLKLFQLVAPEMYQRFVASTVGGSPSQRFFANEQPLEKSRPWCEVLKGNLDRIAVWCREHGADYVVVALPRGFQYDARESPQNWEADEYTVLGPYCLEPFRWFDELRPRVDYPVVSLLSDFQRKHFYPTCFENDPHWTPVGHSIAAKALARELMPIVAARLARQHH